MISKVIQGHWKWRCLIRYISLRINGMR